MKKTEGQGVVYPFWRDSIFFLCYWLLRNHWRILNMVVDV